MKVPVNLAERSYDIVIEPGSLQTAAEFLKPYCRGRAVVLTHPKLARLYGHGLAESLRSQDVPTETLCVPEGEASKRLRVAEEVFERLAAGAYDRRTLLIALGGGVVGDLGGFVAATYLRGIALAQVPTSLLAQVDAAIGGKTGVDLASGKNLVGAFHQPVIVLVDPTALNTLPDRHLRNGLAETLKYGFILDAEFLRSTRAGLSKVLSRDATRLVEVIGRCCEMKAILVSEDERDVTGSRARLNFGHTVGHAIERRLGYETLLHGEAVSIGMVAAARLGSRLGITAGDVASEIVDTLAEAGLPTALPNALGADDLLAAMRTDKKTEAGKLNFVLLETIGVSRLVNDIPEGEARAALDETRTGLNSR